MSNSNSSHATLTGKFKVGDILTSTSDDYALCIGYNYQVQAAQGQYVFVYFNDTDGDYFHESRFVHATAQLGIDSVRMLRES